MCIAVKGQGWGELCRELKVRELSLYRCRNGMQSDLGMGCSRGCDYSGSEVLAQDGAREATVLLRRG